MKNLKIYTRDLLAEYESHRVGAEPWSRHVQYLKSGNAIDEQLRNCTAKYVIFGISEDMGVRANFGKPGARNAWEATLRALLNIQANTYNDPTQILLLGFFDFTEMDPSGSQSTMMKPEAFHSSVIEVDRQVSTLVEKIVKAGKIPIGIGGGHNNAYGMLKGASTGKNRRINAINIDAHADLRPRDYRHSGNGFTYAYEEGFLKRYFIFGLHENYITQSIAAQMEEWAQDVHFVTYEEMCIRGEKSLDKEAKEALNFVAKEGAPFGLEIDCDVMENVPASARTVSGFSVETVRRLNHLFSRNQHIAYLHICEAAPNADDAAEMNSVGKLIAYLITDFIR